MRSIFILATFGFLLLHPGIGSAQAYIECITKCNVEKSASDANCPPPGDEVRMQCLQDNQNAMKSCIESCQQAEHPETPKVTPDTPKEN